MSLKVNMSKSVRKEDRHFIYVAPAGIDVAKYVEGGQLPIHKSVLRPLRLNRTLPSPGDSLIVVKEKPGKDSDYELIALCRVLRPAQKTKEVTEIGSQHFKRVITVKEESVGCPDSCDYSAEIDRQETAELPIILVTTRKAYEEAAKQFPFMSIGRDITQIVSDHGLERHALRGYVYDLEAFKLCRASEVLFRVANDALEATIRSRISDRQCYDMIDRLHKHALKEKGAELNRMDWRQFEKLCGELVRHFGFRVTDTKLTGDHGVDFYAEDNNVFHRGMYIFQIKRTVSVGVEVVRQLDSVVHEQNAIKGIIMTTGTFTHDARRAAETRPIELIEGSMLEKLFKDLTRPSNAAAHS